MFSFLKISILVFFLMFCVSQVLRINLAMFCTNWNEYLQKCETITDKKFLIVPSLKKAGFLPEKYKNINSQHIPDEVISDAIYSNFKNFSKITKEEFKQNLFSN